MNLGFLQWVALSVELTSVAVMLIGFAKAIVQFIPALAQPSQAAVERVQEIRCSLGSYLVFALELMIIADLIQSVVSHSLEDLYFLGAIVVIRTVIAYFLNKEIQEFSRQTAVKE